MADRREPAAVEDAAPERLLLLACGALARETVDLIARNRWQHLEVDCLPAKWHYYPGNIAEGLRRKIRAARGRYDKIYVLYGDCGTGGELDRMLAEEGGIERIEGPHCFSFYAGNAAFADAAEDEITTFYLTDFFCRHFETFVWRALGLDRRDDMVAFVFGNYEKLVYMAQTPDPALRAQAETIAERLGLAYECRFTGYGDLEASLAAVAAPAD